MSKLSHGLLTYEDLCHLVDTGVITGVKHEQINGSSIDITVGDTFLIEKDPFKKGDYPIDWNMPVLDWGRRDSPEMTTVKGSVVLAPSEVCLAQSQQKFYLPNDISCEYKLKSSMARTFLEHLNAGWCDPRWNDSVLTLELVNLLNWHAIRIKAGDPIGQMVFFRSQKAVPEDRSYAARGRYNGDDHVSGIKP